MCWCWFGEVRWLRGRAHECLLYPLFARFLPQTFYSSPPHPAFISPHECTTPTHPHTNKPNQNPTYQHSEEAAEQRAGASSAEDLNDDVVGGRIPRTILKLLVYCRLSDRATCEILLELGKVKVNGVVCDDPVALVDLVKDTIEFDGEPVTLPETRLKHKLRSMAAQSEAEDRADSGVPKDYCARIDGGLLIDLTRNIQKSRGDYVDKSPYIMRDAQRNGGSFGGGGGGGGNYRGGGR